VIVLARHGETADNAPPQRFMGWRDTPLNDRGREQAHRLAATVADLGLAAIWTSGLARARETADIVGAAVGLVAQVDDRLAESHRGRWEGRLVADIEREEPEAWTAWRTAGAGFRFPGGESLEEHQRRALAAIDAVRAGPLPALVICHGGTIRVIAAASDPRGLDAFQDVLPRLPNATPLRLDDLGRWTNAA
jgi:broad specificity phosphatase PhoE